MRTTKRITMETHQIKLNTAYYDCVERRIKNAEVRFNDRDYQPNDWLVLKEWTGTEYTGRIAVRKIIGVFPLDGIGLKGWVLLCMN